jgi:hypothetical protein
MTTAVQWRLNIIARLPKYIGFEVNQNNASVKINVGNNNKKLRGDRKDISIGGLQNYPEISKLTPTYRLIVIFIIIMALQPFVGPSPLFEFLDPIHSR